MKGKIRSSKNRKMIALVATIAVLLTGTVTGVSLFLKDDGSASATGFENEVSNPTAQPSGNNPIQENPEQIPEDETEQEDGEAQGEQSNEGEINPDTQISGVLGTTSQGTTGTSATPQLPQESILYQDRLVAEDFLVGWTPIGLASIMADTNRFINRPILEISKASYTEADLMKTGELAIPEQIKYTAVRQGELIIYEIKVANISNIDAKSIKVIDRVPEKTTLQEIGGEGKEENGVITWIVDIPALAEVKLKFAVTVNNDAEGNAENIAIVNGDETNQAENPIIVTEKVSKIYRDNKEVEKAKVGDTIKYIISIKNTGDIEGTTKVTDKAPEGTTLIKESLKDATLLEDGTILWDNITIPAGEETTVEFEVNINKDVTTSVKNIARVSETSTNEVEDKIEIVDKISNKVWSNDAEILRANVEVELLANGEKTNNVLTLSEQNNWEATFENLQKYDAEGNEIEYTVIELTQIEGYTSKVEGMTITNTYEEPVASKTATKVWEDDIANLRPTSITVQLLADGEKVEGKTLELNAENSWTAEFTNLQKYRTLTREEIVYSVEEVEVPEGYTSKVEGMTVTNTYEEPTTSKTAIKVWEDDSENLRPSSITVQLLADGEEVEGKTLELNAGNSWTAEFTNLQKYRTLTREEIVYSVEEVEVPEGYTSKAEGMILTNTYEEPVTSKTATKVWEDDIANLRPTSITVQLLADGEKVEGKTLELNAENSWTAEFTNLQKYRTLTREEIVYSVEEVSVPEGYTSKANGMTITNTYEEPVASKTVTKVWEGDVASLRPASITVQLLADGEAVEGKTLELNAGNSWTAEFTNLQKYKTLTREEIEYSVEEVSVPEGYTCEANGMTITNTYEEPVTSKTATKVWEGDSENLRPVSITVQLLADGKAVEGKTLELNAENSWTAEFTNLQKYKTLTREEIVYSVEEVSVPEGYTSEVNGMTITNTYEEPTTSKTATKVWEDDVASLRPVSITVQLLADGEAVEGKTLELNAENNWTAEFENLQKYKTLTREEIEYSVEEVSVPEGYTSEVNGMTITNTYEEPVTSKIATKVWEDDVASLRPASITVQLLADGKAVEGKTLELNAENSWTAEFTNLQKYKTLTREEIVYSVEEVSVPEGYTSKVEGMTITNTYEEPVTSKTATKVWEGDSESLRPASITVQLLADGKAIEGKTLELNAENNWTAEFTNLQKYKTLTREEIEYSVEEVSVPEGYTSEVNGMTITNTYEEPEIEISVIKKWEGSKENTSLRPVRGITAEILADGNKIGENGKVVVLNESNKWQDTVDGLQKYKTGTRTPINYTIVELTKIEGYDTTYSQTKVGGVLKELIITNTYVEPTVIKTITKKWVGDTETVRPKTITVELLADGDVVKTAQLPDEKGSWSVTFNDLPKYKEGTKVEIEYTTREVTVPEGYTSKVEGFTITNTYTEPKISKTVKKAWTNDDKYTNHRVNEVEVKLLADGKDTGKTLKLNTSNNWTNTFKDLQKYKTGTKTLINYTVQEVTKVAGYNPSYTTSGNTITVTNTFNKMQTGTITKNWTASSTTKVQVPLDVVFILDTSSSMTYNSDRAEKMIPAVNKAIKEIISYNSENRISVVAFSDYVGATPGLKIEKDYKNKKDANVLLSLKKGYTAKSNSEYLKYDSEKNRVITNVNQLTSQKYRYFEHATYTQAGIELGAKQLMNATDKQPTIDGIKVTRIPVIILVTDGEPTYYTTKYTIPIDANKQDGTISADDSSTKNPDIKGQGLLAKINKNFGYYTIRTAYYFRDQVNSKYGYTEMKTKMYTIGVGVKTQFGMTVLDPGRKVDTSKYVDNGFIDKTVTEALIKQLGSTKYDYADKSYIGEMSTTQLQTAMSQIFTSSIPKTQTWSITQADINNAKTYLPDINISTIKITQDGTNKNYDTSKIIFYDETAKKNYIDLSKLDPSNTITITYTAK